MHSLSARLLVLTIFFVMVAEVLIFVPSVARFRSDWLTEKLESAHLAIIAIDMTPEFMVSERLSMQLLGAIDSRGIFARRGGAKQMVVEDMPPPIDETFDQDAEGTWDQIREALLALGRPGSPRVVRVVGPAPRDSAVQMEVVFDEQQLSGALIDFAGRIFLLSLVISGMTAALVFISLQWLLVRPMRRITENMIAFREEPDDERRVMRPTHRQDEVGLAEEELAGMQRALRQALRQQEHLAALGTAVAKINHDLRGILSTALVVFDRLENSEDPDVRRITPTLFSSIDRAVHLCSEILDYAGPKKLETAADRFALSDLVVDVAHNIDTLTNGKSCVISGVEAGLELTANREQMFRVFENLARNAAQNGAGTIRIDAHPANGEIQVDVCDNGPGLPPVALENLFKPFSASARAGGTGLGLVIARELVQNHGGDLVILETGDTGATFRITLPVSR